jgi:hypothetical protein
MTTPTPKPPELGTVTRKAAAETLTSLGVTGPAQEFVLRKTGSLRHAHRVGLARAALLAAADDNMGAAIAIALADAVGDGKLWRSTTRHPALRGLGKGRKQATDGDAWTAAISCACAELRRDLVGETARWTIFPRDGHPILSGRAEASGAEAEALLTTDLIPDPWLRSIIREGLLESLGLQPLYSKWWSMVGTPAEWSACYANLPPEPEPEPEPVVFHTLASIVGLPQSGRR